MNDVLQDKRVLFWIILGVFLGVSFVSYGKYLLSTWSDSKHALRRLGWTITITILIFLYAVEKEVNNEGTRRLINSVLIFAGTFSYLYCLSLLSNEKSPSHNMDGLSWNF